MINRINVSFVLFVLLTIWLIPYSAKATELQGFDDQVRDLIKDKLSDDSLYIDLSFESNLKADKIRNYNDVLKDVILLNFSPIYSTFKVKVIADEYTENISGRYIAFKNVPVAARQLVSGTIVSPADIVENMVKASKVKSGIVVAKEQAIGMQTKRNIPSGSQIRDIDISKPHIVRDKDEVTMLYRSRNLELKASGIAGEGGAMGDYIKAKNASTGKLVHGKIMSPNLILINED